MKTFFNDVMAELAIRYGHPITLQTSEELAILKEILSAYEQGTFGRNVQKANRRVSRQKKLLKTSKPENFGKLAKKIYSEVDLYLESNDSLLLLESGYKKGAFYNAPGNAGSAFNETLSNEGVMILAKYDISLEDLALVIYYRTLNTELGKQQKDTPRMGIPIPDEVPRVHQNLYVSSYLSAKSAFAKHNRMKIGIQKLEERVGFKNDHIMGYGGSSNDLQTISDTIISANVCYIFDIDLDKIVEIPRLKMLNWALSAGSGENSGDTVILAKDKNGNILYDGWSDKKALNDIQGNSTLKDDLSKTKKRIEKFHKLGMIDKNTMDLSISITEKFKTEILDTEEEYQNAAVGEARYMKGLSDKTLLSLWMDIQESFYIKNKTSNHIENSKTLDDFSGAENSQYLEYLVIFGVDKSATRNKIINRIALMEREWLKRNKLPIPQSLDTKGIVSIARESVMHQHDTLIQELNKISISNKSLGDLVLFYDTIDFLQINKIKQPSSDVDYKQFLKRNTNLVMEGIPITPEIIKSSLNIESLSKYIEESVFSIDTRIMYDVKNKYVTGKVVTLFTTNHGTRKNIGTQIYRSRQGFTGKTSNTIQWSTEIQNRFKKTTE